MRTPMTVAPPEVADRPPTMEPRIPPPLAATSRRGDRARRPLRRVLRTVGRRGADLSLGGPPLPRHRAPSRARLSPSEQHDRPGWLCARAPLHFAAVTDHAAPARLAIGRYE